MPRLEAPEGYSAAILHTHTNKSDGLVTPDKVVEAAKNVGARVVAISDHDTFSGIAEAQRKAEELEIYFVIGNEIQCKNFKHLLALFLKLPKKEIPHSKPIDETAKKIRELQGFVIAPHPLSGRRDALTKDQLLRLIELGLLDGIEVLYPRIPDGVSQELKDLSQQDGVNLAQFGSSDSHFGLKDIGINFTLFPGNNLEDIFKAIGRKTTIPSKGLVPTPPTISETINNKFKAYFILTGRRFFDNLNNLKRP